MNEAIDILMNEHRVIERVLGSLETFIELPPPARAAARPTVAQYAHFFRRFADQCHHGKEEDQLFARLNDYGFPREYGPVAVMLAEHTEGRAEVRVLAQIGAQNGPLTPEEWQQVTDHARALIPLLRAHIQKEDHVLFPMAGRALPLRELTGLIRTFGEFEKTALPGSEKEQLLALAEELTAAYPPDPVKMANAQACVGCAGH